MRTLLLLAASGCFSIEAPQPLNEPIQGPDSTGVATAVVVAAYAAALQVPLDASDAYDISWYAPLTSPGGHAALEYELQGPKRPHLWCQGITFHDAGAIHLIPVSSDSPSGSALAHELLHWALTQRDGFGHGDSSHSGPEWGLVKQINQVLQEVQL